MCHPSRFTHSRTLVRDRASQFTGDFIAASERVVALAPSWDDFMAAKRAEFGDDERFDALSGKLGMMAGGLKRMLRR